MTDPANKAKLAALGNAWYAKKKRKKVWAPIKAQTLSRECLAKDYKDCG